MLVGDYCPRALDPVLTMLDAQAEMYQAASALTEIESAVAQNVDPLYHPAHMSEYYHTTELPCNVFGTVDRCDGMACEHDGNCFNGCCSLFVSGDQKRCMPLVGGDLCPIAIDVVEQFQIVDQKALKAAQGDLDSLQEADKDQKKDQKKDEKKDEKEDKDEDPPIIEKGEHHHQSQQEDGIPEEELENEIYDSDINELYDEDEDQIDHIISEKSEHQEEEAQYVEHYIPVKGEHSLDQT